MTAPTMPVTPMPCTVHLAEDELGYALTISTRDDDGGCHLTKHVTAADILLIRRRCSSLLSGDGLTAGCVYFERGGYLSLRLFDGEYDCRLDCRSMKLAFVISNIGLFSLKDECVEWLRVFIDRVKETPTPLGSAHEDDGTPCAEPAWCAREHVRTPTQRCCPVCQGPLETDDKGPECDPTGCPERNG